ncbi:glycosyltransferase [Marivirga salinae]|uniref:Glycosyltransferase n=1 Tax=Marivirga salinarum TaxID=3059078 RepID=A0AA49GE05_9BACT|nr:glycosyltransferase [Marivirga sp. BDSF4-3]WKK74871.1 glycosyltransferase [Marivirga sp. BDSF4-3]
MKTNLTSVIVCTYNRQEYLPECLNHLAEQSAEKADYEVLIIDNNSTDNTATIAHEFINSNPDLNAHYFCEMNQGLTFGRNRGIKEAKGEVLSFIDDDAFVEYNFIKEIKSYFDENQDVSAIGGKISPVYEAEEPKWMSKYLLTLVAALDMGNSPKKFKGTKFPIGANMAFRSTVFKKYGLFNTDLGRRGDVLEGGEEKELFLRLKKHKEIIHYVPNVKVDHIIPEKRLTMEYIKGLGIGVGSSEIKRLKRAGTTKWINKILSELIKISATILLFFIYLFKGRFSAASVLIKFRFWVLKGMLKKRIV